MNEETPSGSGTTHSTHGIVIQELSHTGNPPTHDPVKCPTTKSRSFQYIPPSIESFSLGKKLEPNLSLKTPLSHDAGFSSFLSNRGLMWVVVHSLFNSQASVPDWSGWLSKTSEVNLSHQQSNIGYMTPILQPITQAATVQQCLVTSQAVSKKLDQKYTFVTFDLAAAKLAYSVIWSNPSRFSDVYIHLGAFHIICCFLGAVGRMMIGSGFEEIVIESGICSSGSIDQVLSGKHYNRALRVHQLMAIALDKLLLQEFVERTCYDTSQLQELQLLATFPCSEYMSATEDSESWRIFNGQFSAFADAARQGTFGHTCQFWMQYHDCIWLLLTFLQSIKENNLPAYVSCLRLFCPMIFAADRVNYARYLPLYYVQLSQLMSECPNAYELLKYSGISVSRSDAPSCRNAIDMTIEQTINRSAKTSGGIIGFSRNVSAYYRWCITRHQRALFLEATRDRVGINRCSANTCCTRKSDLKHMEKDVQRVHQAFQNFINPMSCTNDTDSNLYCLSSGKPASGDVADSLLSFVSCGDAAAQTFIQDRLISKSVKFHEPIKKMRMKTFANMAVHKQLSSGQQKSVRVKAERNLLGHLLALCQSYDISLEKLFRYELSPIPWSLATADGSMCKTNKAQLLHALESESIQPPEDNCVCILDGNALLHSFVRVPATFGDFAQAVFNCLPKSKYVHFVTDTYHEHSIKDSERQRRGTSSAYLIGGPWTKMPRDWAKFLQNSQNKRQLLKFILCQWQQAGFADKMSDRTIFFVCEGACVCLRSIDSVTVTATEISELHSTHEEADTRIILHCLYATKHHLDKATDSIVVRSPDTDVFVLFVHTPDKCPCHF